MVAWRDVLIQIIAQAVIAKLENRMTKEEPLMAPPISYAKQYYIPLRRIFLPPSAKTVLEKLADALNTKEEEVAEMILQAVLHSVPILEALNDAALSAEEIKERLVDSMSRNTGLNSRRQRRLRN